MLFKFYDIVKQSLRTLFVQVLPILLLSACSSDEAKDDLNTKEGLAQQYINLTITVSSGSQQEGTRANGDNNASAGNTSAEATRGPRPLGGEDGDGRENGLEDENDVKGITLILTDGQMNYSNTKIAFIKYYEVTKMEGTGTNEKIYTTGDQPVKVSELNLTENKTYYIYVVANHNIVANKGDDPSTIREKMLDFGDLFTGDNYAPDGCQDFVMASSEQGVEVNFKTLENIDLTEERNAAYYTLKNPITIERLAARLDFCTAYNGNSNNADYDEYDVVGEDGKETTVTGFKYNTTPGEGYFILESIIPFNIYNEQQYLFRHVFSEFGSTYTKRYMIDPKTFEKVSTGLNYVSPLAAEMPTTQWKEWERTAKSLNDQERKTKVAIENDNFVLAYCIENILTTGSPLKDYATGLVIKGSYYDKNGNFLTRKTFYEYLRHQGDNETYTPTELTGPNLEEDDLENKTRIGDTGNNFSIVRNNIYRVNIESVDSRGNISVKLAVKDWREVKHPEIYL